MKDAFGCERVRLKRGCGAFPGSALARLWVNGEAKKTPRRSVFDAALGPALALFGGKSVV
jgi:hypothetical protein